MSNTRNASDDTLVADKRELPAIRARKRLQKRLREVQVNRLKRELERCQESKKI